MKKITKIAATFAVAMAMLFVGASCSHDGGASLATLGAGGGGGGDDDEEEEGASVSYDFADLSAADFTTLGVTVTGSNDIKIGTANTATTPYKVLGGKVGIVTTVKDKLTVKPKDGAPLAIGFNTNGVNATGASTTVGDTVTLDHFITYPVESGKKYKMEITSGGQANNTEHYFVVTDTTAKIIASKVCSSSTTDAVSLSFEAAEDVVRLSVYRKNGGGTSYVGKVTLTETSGGSNDPAVDPDGDDDDDGDDDEEDEEPEEPIPFTGSFVGLNGASFGLAPLTGETDLKDTTELKSADNSISASLKSNSSGGNLKITFSDGKSAGIKYNGSSLASGSDSISYPVTVSTLSRYISVPVKTGKTITVSYKANTSSNGSETAKVALVNASDGTKLEEDNVNVKTDSSEHTISTTVSNDIDVLILFSREGVNSGGLIVTKFEIN